MCAIASGQYKVEKIDSESILISNRNIYPSVENVPEKIRIQWPADKSDNVVKALEEKRGDLTVEHSFALGLQKLQELKNNGITIIEEPPLRMHFVHLNFKRFPFSNKQLRQNFRDVFFSKISVDKDFLSSGITPDQSFIPKGGVGYKAFPERKKYQT